MNKLTKILLALPLVLSVSCNSREGKKELRSLENAKVVWERPCFAGRYSEYVVNNNASYYIVYSDTGDDFFNEGDEFKGTISISPGRLSYKKFYSNGKLVEGKFPYGELVSFEKRTE